MHRFLPSVKTYRDYSLIYLCTTILIYYKFRLKTHVHVEGIYDALPLCTLLMHRTFLLLVYSRTQGNKRVRRKIEGTPPLLHHSFTSLLLIHQLSFECFNSFKYFPKLEDKGF